MLRSRSAAGGDADDGPIEMEDILKRKLSTQQLQQQADRRRTEEADDDDDDDADGPDVTPTSSVISKKRKAMPFKSDSNGRSLARTVSARPLSLTCSAWLLLLSGRLLWLCSCWCWARPSPPRG